MASGFVPGQAGLLHLSAAPWIVAFGGFTITFFGTLTGPRLTAKQPMRL